MNKSAIVTRLVELEAKHDLVLFRVRRDPRTGELVDEEGNPVATAAKAGLGVAAGGGVLYGGAKLAKRYGANQVTSPRKAVQAVGRGIARDASTAVTAAGNKVGAVSGTGSEAFKKAIRRGGGFRRAIRAGVSAVTGGRVRFDVKQRLIEMGAVEH